MGVGPAIRLPIFEGGRCAPTCAASRPISTPRSTSYNATVIDAVRDVADQVTSALYVARQQAPAGEAQAAAEAAYDLGLQRYGAGLGNYLDVLTAEVSVLAQRRDGVDFAARALENQVGLARPGRRLAAVGRHHAAAAPAPRHPRTLANDRSESERHRSWVTATTAICN